VKDSAGHVQARALYERYKCWVKETNGYQLKERRFNEAMDEHGYMSIKQHNKKLYTGFRLRDPREGFGERPGKSMEEEIPEDVL